MKTPHTHEFTCDHRFFAAVSEGIRKAVMVHDRQVEPYDILEFTEVDRLGNPTGRLVSGWVSYVEHVELQRNSEWFYLELCSMEWISFVHHDILAKPTSRAPEGIQ